MESARSVGGPQQANDLEGQAAQRGDAQAFARFGEGVAGGSLALAETLQPLEDLTVGVLAEEAQADGEEAHEPVGKARATAVGVTGLFEDLLNRLHRDDTFQSKESLRRRQAVEGLQNVRRITHRGLPVVWWCRYPILTGGLDFVYALSFSYARVICRSVRYWR